VTFCRTPTQNETGYRLSDILVVVMNIAVLVDGRNRAASFLAGWRVNSFVTSPDPDKYFLGSSFKCNTHGPQGIGCCDGQTIQAP
jgi:hypothetical protein